MIKNQKLLKLFRRVLLDQLIEDFKELVDSMNQIYRNNGKKWTPDNTEEDWIKIIEWSTELRFFRTGEIHRYEKNKQDIRETISRLVSIKLAIQKFYPEDIELFDVLFPFDRLGSKVNK